MSPRKSPVLLTTTDVAELLQVSPEQVRRYFKTKRLAFERIGRIYGVRPAELERFKQKPPPKRGRPKKTG